MVSKEKRGEYNKTFYKKHPGYWHRYKEKKDAYMKEYYQRPGVKQKRKEHSRQHHLFVLGKDLVVHKRKRPDNICEVCGGEVKKLDYHHWDDSHPEQGIWVCYRCHQRAEGTDTPWEYLGIYLGLKQEIMCADS